MFPGATKYLEKMNVTTMKRSPLNYFTKLVDMIMERKATNTHDQVSFIVQDREYYRTI